MSEQINNSIFGITYDTWNTVCNMYFCDDCAHRFKYYLQWYPFSKLSKHDMDFIKSREFYDNYIKNFDCVFYKTEMFCSHNYMLKEDGSFRNCTLISPLLYTIKDLKLIIKDYIEEKTKCT